MTMEDLPGLVPPIAAAPGSAADLHAQVRAAWHGHVLRLRFCGVYLPVQLLRGRPVVPGLIVSRKFDGGQRTRLMDAACEHQLLPELFNPVVLKRRIDGSMLIQGLEWDEGHLQQWPQTWLAAQTPEEAVEIMQGMAGWLKSRYTGKMATP